MSHLVSSPTHLFLPLFLILLSPGCDQDNSANGTGCPIADCGVNSAETSRVPIGELHLNDGQNQGEISRVEAQVIDFFGPDGASDYVLSAYDGQFFATRDQVTVSGADLVGMRIVVQNHESGRAVQLLFERHQRISTWTEPEPGTGAVESPFIDLYAFSFYRPDDGVGAPVCINAGGDIESEGALAVVVTGERYDNATNQVRETGTDAAGWFNIACSGSGLFKMKLMGYEAQPADPATRVTTPEQRQATLKMLTANYCPEQGDELTRDGTRLHWQNRAGWSYNSASNGGALESYWDAQGALCVDLPRLGSDELRRVLENCPSLPTCDGFAGDYEWRTESPPEA